MHCIKLSRKSKCSFTKVKIEKNNCKENVMNYRCRINKLYNKILNLTNHWSIKNHKLSY